MAFSFGSGGPSTLSNAQTQTGPDLEEISTDELGFHALAGEAKVRLLPSSWPLDALPPPTASLLSVASKRGLLAAGGPDLVVVSSTKSLRDAFAALRDKIDTTPFAPQLTIPVGTRVSQIAFSANESYLVISAEVGGGLAVYEMESLMQGSTQSTFQLPTNGTSVRALAPNPAPEQAELFAVVTANGELLIANLKTREFLKGVNSQILKDNVSCVSWSNKGKQLIAGLADGTAYQLTPEGMEKGAIPRPSNFEDDQERHVSAILWLNNHEFLEAHTPSSSDSGVSSATSYNIVTRKPPSEFIFQKLPEVCAPYGLDRSPPFQFFQRLKDFPPSLRDLILVASTASEDVGIFSRSSNPLTKECEEEKIKDIFTTTTITTDSRRAALPMTEDLLNNTSPIGMALDLSGDEPAYSPVPNEDIDKSSTPVPALLILNNDGLLAAWWIIYNDSIRQGVGYPKLSAMNSDPQMQINKPSQGPPFGSATETSFPATSQTTLKNPSVADTAGNGMSKSTTPIFGSSSILGGGPTAFGSPSGIGSQPSPWAAKNKTAQLGGSGSDRPTTGIPAFGSSTALGANASGTTFGMTGGLGNRLSPWSTSSSSLGHTKGLSPFGNTAPTPTFGTNLSSTSSVLSGGGGFASHAKAGGFASATTTQGNEGSIFGKPAQFSSANTNSAIGQTPNKSDQSSGSVFGPGSGFSLSSTFKRDDLGTEDEMGPPIKGATSLFGEDFESKLGVTLKEPTTPLTKETDMLSDANDDDDLSSTHSSPMERETTTPADTPAPSKFFPSTAPTVGGQFGTQAQSTTALAAVQSSTPAIASSLEPLRTTAIQQFESPRIKLEPSDAKDGIRKIPPEPPLPPDPRSKASYTPSDSSTSSAAPSNLNMDEAPLPPDFLASKFKAKIGKETPPDQPVLFPEGDSSSPPNFLPSKGKANTISVIPPENPTLPPDSDASLPSGSLPSKNMTKRIDQMPTEEPVLLQDDNDDDLDDEGSGVDVAQEISPSSGHQSPKATPESSFGAGPERSPLGGLFTNIGRHQLHQPSKPLFGELGMTSAPFLPPPSKIQESPRSPSPIRSSMLGDVLRPDNARSVSAPGITSKALGQRPAAPGRYPQTIVPVTPQSSTEERQNKERERLAAERARQKVEEEQNLTDHEDERVRNELKSVIKGTLTLDPFLAHQDYVGSIDKSGVPGQIERVYRDINSMIDTLGLNVRSLSAFAKGHCEQLKEQPRDREDLRSHRGWCLTEIDDLVVLETTLEKELEQSRLQDVQDKIDQCLNLRKELSKIRSKRNEMKRIVDAKTDPDLIEAVRSAPLTAEQSTTQHNLRRDFISFQKLLADAEEGLILLRTKLASYESASGAKRHLSSSSSQQKVPTVEAVTNTILKMTSMVTKKSGDIDVLENQMRKLKLLNAGDADASDRPSPSGRSSRDSSPFVTPPTTFTKRGRASVSGATRTPNKGRRSVFAASVGSSTGTPTPARKKMMGREVQPEEARRWEGKAKRRREVTRLVKDALVKEGVRVRGLDRI